MRNCFASYTLHVYNTRKEFLCRASLRVFMLMVVSPSSVLAHAVGSSDETDFSQASAMQISLQKEVYGILLSDTVEVQQEYRADGTFYTSDALAPYRSILKAICSEAARSDCPPTSPLRNERSKVLRPYIPMACWL